MVKRKNTFHSIKNQPEWTKNICGNCNHGSWIDSHSNLDWNKKPICLKCPFEKYNIIRSQKACINFKKKEACNE